MINNVDIDYEWLIKEVKSKNPQNLVDVYHCVCSILKLDKDTNDIPKIMDIINIMCDLDANLKCISKRYDK